MMKSGIHRWVLLGLAVLPLAGGCVERHFIITTDPGDAIIEYKGIPVSSSPADLQFLYTGRKYKFVAQKEGYEVTEHIENVKSRWYEVFGMDFISEHIIPFTIRDERRINIHLNPLQNIPPDLLLPAAKALRERGQAVVYTPPSQNLQAPPAAGAPPAPPTMPAPPP